MRVLFVYPNVQKGALTPQLGIASLSAVLKQNGHTCDLYDITVVPEGREISEFTHKVKSFDPDLIGYSIRSNEVGMVRSLLEAVPKDKVVSVAGGHHVTVAPEDTLRDFDIAVRGEGEEALLEVVERLEAGDSIRDVKNVWLREGDTVHKNELRPLIPNLDDLPNPDWSLFHERHYTESYLKGSVARNAKIVGAFEGSRGCIFKCTYCSSPTVMNMYGGTKWRREKSANRLADEINAFEKEYGLDFIYFVDEIFLTQIPRLREIRDVFRERVRKPFTFMERPELINEEKIKLISEAGATAVAIGVESGDEEFRKKVLDRSTSQGKIVEAFRLAKKYGLHTHAFNMVGLPHETAEVIEKNFALLQTLKPDSFQVSIFYPLRGTRLHTVCKEQGYLDSDEMPENYYEQSSLTMPEGFSKEQIARYQKLMSWYAGRPSRLAGWAFHLLARHPALFQQVQKVYRLHEAVERNGLLGTIKKIPRKVGEAVRRRPRVTAEDMVVIQRETDPIYQKFNRPAS